MSKQKAEAALAERVSAIDRLPKRWAVFAREYLIDFNGAAAAVRAGYAERGAKVQASRMLTNTNLQTAIRELVDARANRLEIDGDEIVRRWHAILNADPNELTQYRRLCCRHCWGEGFQYQRTPAEYGKAKLRHAEQRAETLFKSDQKVDIGEFAEVPGNWFDKRRDPNPICPECHGDGVGEPFFLDTRKLSPAALALFAGVKETRDGLEIMMASRERAAENLARALGLFKDKEAEVNIHLPAGEELARLFEEKMAKSRARQEQVMAERGIKPDGG
ncbi:terminase small subunit [Azonexus sp. IMCC34842]|uniref:terminase small subunit n=1 Tax=Azonexus sp. IMCC34842 TaxID=3420950 RepID=UPI003D113D21